MKKLYSFYLEWGNDFIYAGSEFCNSLEEAEWLAEMKGLVVKDFTV